MISGQLWLVVERIHMGNAPGGIEKDHAVGPGSTMAGTSSKWIGRSCLQIIPDTTEGGCGKTTGGVLEKLAASWWE